MELSGIAQMSGMVPAADNNFKYNYSQRGGKATVAKEGKHDLHHMWLLILDLVRDRIKSGSKWDIFYGIEAKATQLNKLKINTCR